LLALDGVAGFGIEGQSHETPDPARRTKLALKKTILSFDNASIGQFGFTRPSAGGILATGIEGSDEILLTAA
jgi:hypothetical protein